MNRLKKIMLSPWTSGVLFALAAVLLLTGVIGGARAAMSDQTQVYVSGTSLYSIGVSMYENDDPNPVAFRNYVVNEDGTADGTWSVGSRPLLQNMVAEGKTFSSGTLYDEKLYVGNTGNIDEYVRVTLYHYWLKDGKKIQSMSPDMIKLVTAEGSGWLLDKQASTEERMVFYYSSILPVGATTEPVLKGITVNLDEQKAKPVVTTETWKDSDNVIHTRRVYAYEFDGSIFCLEAEVDAVQTHNAAAAIRSAWGAVVSVSESGGLSLAH